MRDGGGSAAAPPHTPQPTERPLHPTPPSRPSAGRGGGGRGCGNGSANANGSGRERERGRGADADVDSGPVILSAKREGSPDVWRKSSRHDRADVAFAA